MRNAAKSTAEKRNACADARIQTRVATVVCRALVNHDADVFNARPETDAIGSATGDAKPVEGERKLSLFRDAVGSFSFTLPLS
jgi:hypothetical protein